MTLFNRIKAVFSKETPIQTQTRSFFPNTLKPYGHLSQSILGISAHITGKKPLISNDVAAKQANYYLRTNHAVASFVREVVNQSVGITLGNLQSKITDLSPEENQRLNSKIETAWIDFSKAENIDLSGRFNLTEFLSLTLTNYLIEGESNIRIFNTGKYKNKYQLLDFISLDYNRTGGNCFNGIEIDGFTTPVAYWIVDSSEQRFKIPAKEFIHFGNYMSVSDYRGTSLLSTAFSTLDKIDAYESAEIEAAINEATKVIYYKSDNSYMKAYEGAATAQDIANFNPATPATPSITLPYNPTALLAGSGVQHGGIAIEALPAGVDLGQLSSNHPNNGFTEANKMLYKNLGAALGIPYSTLLLDLSDTNYSSMRSGEIFKRPLFRKLSLLLINKVLTVIFENFINNFINDNKADFPKLNNSYAVYKAPNFPLPKFSYINPLDDIEADIKALDNGLRNWSDVIGEQGMDFEDFLKQKKLDDDLMTSILGTTLKTETEKANMVEYFKAKQTVNTSNTNKQ